MVASQPVATSCALRGGVLGITCIPTETVGGPGGSSTRGIVVALRHRLRYGEPRLGCAGVRVGLYASVVLHPAWLDCNSKKYNIP